MITKNRYRLLRMIMLFALLLTPFMVYAQDDHLPPSEALDVVNHLVGEWPEYSIWIIGAFITLIFIYVVTILFKRGNGIFEKKDTIAFSFISLLGLLQIFQYYSGDSLGKKSITIPVAITFAIISLVAFVYFFLNIRKYTNIYRRLLFQAICIWIVGYWTYFIAFFQEGTYDSLAAVIIRPALSAAEMFVSYCDLQEIPDNLKVQPIYICIFYLANFAAIYTSFSLVIELVGYKLEAYFCLRRACKETGKPLFIMIGINMATERMAQSIRREYGWQNTCNILFVCDNSRAVQPEGRFNLSSIVDMLTYHKVAYDVAKKYKALLCISEGNFCERIETDRNNDSFFHIYKLEALEKLMSQSSNTYAFFLSDNEQDNLRGAETFLLGAKHLPNIKCYVRAHDNSYNEALLLNHPDKIEIIDSSQKSINELECKIESQPVSFVDIQEDCTVSSPFKAHIVGFGRTGQDALGFLYEFGAFVDSVHNNERSPFYCTIIDKNMNQIYGSYFSKRPALKHLSSNVSITLKEWSTNSSEYWEWLETNISSLNYIVIAIGDDELGITLAVSLFSMAYQKGRNGSPFSIFVRCYKRENVRRMEQLATYYSERFYKDMLNIKIVVFGQFDNIFSYNSIINNIFEKEARKYHEAILHIDKDSEITWDMRHAKINARNTYSDVKDLQRREYQDISNSQHAKTKLLLYGQGDIDVPKRDLSMILETFKSRTGSRDTISYAIGGLEFNRKMLNLARTEHLRWVASHELLGYVKSPLGALEIDNIRKIHACMYDWDMLDEVSRKISFRENWIADFKYYDYLSVEASFRYLFDNDLNKN